MELRIVRDQESLDWALAEVARYFDHEPEPGSPEAERFELLALLINRYEAAQWPAKGLDPVEILHFAIEDMGRSQGELGLILGSQPRASEVLNRKRALTIEMIDKISKAWAIPRDVLARPYSLEGRSPEGDVDAHAPELTDAELAEMRPAAEVLPPAFYAMVTKRPRGRPRAAETKIPVTLRLDREVVEAFKAAGPGWQTRINEKLRDSLGPGRRRSKPAGPRRP